MFDHLFPEETSASRNERQQLDHLLRIAVPHERAILAGIGVLLLVFAAWVAFGSVTRSVVADGLLIEPGERHTVVSTESGHLVEFLAALGDRIEAGSPVARQSVPELEHEMAILRDRIVLLEAQAGQDSGASRPLLDSARTVLSQMEARSATRELIVSHAGGEVMALQVAVGDYLLAGTPVAQLRDAEGRPLHAVVHAAPHVAQRIQPGMQASVEIAMPDGAWRQADGEVAAVTTGPLSPAAGIRTHRVDVQLHSGAELSAMAGAPCRVRIVTGQHSLLALLAPERFSSGAAPVLKRSGEN